MTTSRILPIFVFAAVVSAVGLPALGATLSFAPAQVSVQQGRTFTVAVGLDPQGAPSYTVKAEVRYPASLLEVVSFDLGRDWMALSQPGYDLVDNPNGRLIKTAGYPGGASGPVAFGTITFRAKGNGDGEISMGGASLAFDAGNNDVLKSTGARSMVRISPAAAAPVPETAAPSPAPVPAPGEDEAGVPAGLPAAPGEGAGEEAGTDAHKPQTLLAQVGSALTLGTNRALVGALVLIAVLVGVYAAWRRWRGRDERRFPRY